MAVAVAASEQMPNPRAHLGFNGLLTRLTETLARWDGGWYRSIVEHGYADPSGHASPSVAFFPGFPMLVRGLSQLSGVPDLIVAPCLSNLCALLAALLFFQLIASERDETSGYFAALFLLFAPCSIHLSAYYTESLFLLLSIGAYWAASRERWLVVAVLGAFASATRATGFLLSLALFLNYWQQRGLGRPLRDALWPNLAIALTGVGALGYALYLHLTFGSLSVYFRAQATEWPRRFGAGTFFRMLGDVDALVHSSVETLLQGFLPSMVALIGGIWLLHRRRLGDAALVLGSLYLALGGGTFESTQRYLLSLFPLYVLPATWRGIELRAILLAASAVLMGYWSALFGGGWHFT
ncbi:MAG TPA: mannosyltransferase family protein [Polyangiaceae bacterium]|nr:mannosyltransferase family protein [Polyangiaceae bacterium]